MVIVQICVGSSCHIKGSAEIVSLMQKTISEMGLDDEIVLAGSFCTGRCNREGVTVSVDDDTFTGVTKENFKEFFEEKILKKIKE
ncbi:MAG: (2Fe-2S) ferredoxin domain-containing protein [Clostridia bacterium]|nr:(2Fe-2S) ferredoxin domain-containing protein [Clostridia bacterium]